MGRKGDYSLACAKNKKSLNFALSDSWHLKVGMETPENNFQIYRPINDPLQAVLSLAGDIAGKYPKKEWSIIFDWSVLRT